MLERSGVFVQTLDSIRHESRDWGIKQRTRQVPRRSFQRKATGLEARVRYRS